MTCPCFVAGTLVTMADGTHKPIEQIQPGEQVLSRDPITGEVKPEPVAQVFTHPTEQTVTVTLSDGETLTCTPSHPFYVAGRGFVPAGELTQGEHLVSGLEAQGGKNAAVTVSRVVWQKASAGTQTVVYNLGIASTHTYFVGSDNQGVWVHNICEEGLEAVKSHLGRPELDPDDSGANDMMIKRLEDALNNGKELEGADKDFYEHELYEKQLMDNGMGYDEAHEAALKDLNVSRYALYHPEVISATPGWWGPGYYTYWGIAR